MAIFGQIAFAVAPWGDGEDDISSLQPYLSAVLAHSADRVFLVELHTVRINPEAGASSGGVIAVFGSPPPFGALSPDLEADPHGGPVPIYLSDKGYITTPADSLPNVNFQGLLNQPLKVQRSLPVDPAADRKIALQIGAIEVSNGDGSLSEAFNSTDIANRQIIVRMGRRGDAYADYGLVASLLGLDRYGSRASTWVTATDVAALLDVPLQPATYAGTGGLEGGADLAGKRKPWGAGRLRNVPAVSIDPNTGQMFQLSYRAIAGLDVVRSSGVAVTPMGGGAVATDFASFSDLAAAAVPAGFYATCLAQGVFKLGSANTTVVTADFRGDAASSTGYAATHGGIVRLMLTDLLALPPEQVSIASFVSLAAAVPGEAGYWAGTEAITASTAIGTLFRGITGWIGSDLYGQIQVGRITSPDGRVAAISFDGQNIRSEVTKVSQSGDLAYPNWRRTLGYAFNWRAMSASEMAGSLAASTASADKQLVAFLGAETRSVQQASTRALINYGKAIDGDPVQGYFANEADAQAEVDRQIVLFSLRPDGTPREAFSFTVGYDGLLATLDMAVRVTWPDFSLDQGRVLTVTGLDLDCAAGTVTLTVWG